MIDSVPDGGEVIRCKDHLRRDLQYVDTFRPITGGSENLLIDQNLQAVLRIMAGFSQGSLHVSKVNIQKESMYLAASASPEHGLHVSGGSLSPSKVVVGSEVKALEASMRQCYPQLISVCGSGCIEMHRLGLAREDCVVLGIAMAGSSCQFCAMYLLPDNFPVLVALTPEFNFDRERQAVAEWCLRFV